MRCARCGQAGLVHYWPEPGESREAVKRAWLTARGCALADRVCSLCMMQLETGRAP